MAYFLSVFEENEHDTSKLWNKILVHIHVAISMLKILHFRKNELHIRMFPWEWRHFAQPFFFTLFAF